MIEWKNTTVEVASCRVYRTTHSERSDEDAAGQSGENATLHTVLLVLRNTVRSVDDGETVLQRVSVQGAHCEETVLRRIHSISAPGG